jgi:hypothetical protein
MAEGTQTIFGTQTKALRPLLELARECARPDWDGYGAMAVDPIALQNTEAFVRILPESIPMPEFAAEPDGAISLDWIQSRHRLFSLSIGPSKRLAYAWLDGTDKGHGVARFDGTSIPDRVLAEIRSIMGKSDACFRAA